MLVLSRYVGQRIKIGENIWITLVEIRNEDDKRKARIGIEAPQDVVIVREELIHGAGISPPAKDGLPIQPGLCLLCHEPLLQRADKSWHCWQCGAVEWPEKSDG